MADMMTFPETWEEFEQSYGFVDGEKIYTNGSRLIPSFRVKQWLDHIAHLESKQQATVSSDCISRQAAKDVVDMELDAIDHVPEWVYDRLLTALDQVPSAQPERLTDDDFETIRIHLNAYKEKLCNQKRWKEAEEYQRIIDRLMAFASAEPERKKGEWIKVMEGNAYRDKCNQCGRLYPNAYGYNFCPNCGADMRGE